MVAPPLVSCIMWQWARQQPGHVMIGNSSATMLGGSTCVLTAVAVVTHGTEIDTDNQEPHSSQQLSDGRTAGEISKVEMQSAAVTSHFNKSSGNQSFSKSSSHQSFNKGSGHQSFNKSSGHQSFNKSSGQAVIQQEQR